MTYTVSSGTLNSTIPYLKKHKYRSYAVIRLGSRPWTIFQLPRLFVGQIQTLHEHVGERICGAYIGVHASAEHGLQSAGASDRHLAVRGAVCSERGREAEFAVRPRRVVQRAGAGVRAAVRRSPLRRRQYVHAYA